MTESKMKVSELELGNKIGYIVDWLVHYRLLSVTILGTSIILAAIIIAAGPSAEPEARNEKAWPVSTLVAKPAALQPSLAAFGKVESRQNAQLKTSITAPVAEVLTPEGSWVNQGDLLVRLDDQELNLALIVANAEYKRRQAQLASIRSDYELANNITANHQELKDIAQAKLERHTNLFNSKMVSDAIVDEVRREVNERAITLQRHLANLRAFPNLIDQHEASVAEGEALVNRAKMDVDQTRILAPFNGRVIATFVSAGDRVLPGASVIQVADYQELEVRSALPSDIGYVLRQQAANGVVISATGTVDGRVIKFTMDRLSGDVKTGQSGLDAFFTSGKDVKLDIGRVINLTITLPEELDVVALPIQSIYQNDRVYRVSENRLQTVKINQIGDYLDGDGNYRVLVRSADIHQGDVLIATQLPRAITGLLVDPIDSSQFEEALAGGSQDISNAVN